MLHSANAPENALQRPYLWEQLVIVARLFLAEVYNFPSLKKSYY